MKRPYNSSSNKPVTAFIGTEVEHTPAFGKLTLFVVGIQNPQNIINECRLRNIDHVYLGANMSFVEATDEWDELVFSLLKEGLWVTLDYPVKHHEWILESGYAEYNKFIPMISVKLPYIEQLGYNACIKLDDKTFDATNHGVWVHRVHDLKNKEVFTDWSKYTQDEPVDLDD